MTTEKDLTLKLAGVGAYRVNGPFPFARVPDVFGFGKSGKAYAFDYCDPARAAEITALGQAFLATLIKHIPSPSVRPGRIPVMDDPLGKHWRQPKNLRDRVEVYETHAVISEADFFALSNYETTTPGGVYPGKVWRQGRKWLCWWGPDKGGKCRCCCVRVLIV